MRQNAMKIKLNDKQWRFLHGTLAAGCLLVAGVGCAGSGAARTGDDVVYDPGVAGYGEPRTEYVGLGRTDVGRAAMEVRDAEDPRQTVPFALELDKQGRHLEAARVFEAVADHNWMLGSRRLSLSSRGAAATSFLKAGDMDGFWRNARELKNSADQYQLAALGEQERMVLALADYSSGQSIDPHNIPGDLKPLLNE